MQIQVEFYPYLSIGLVHSEGLHNDQVASSQEVNPVHLENIFSLSVERSRGDTYNMVVT